MFSQPGLTRYAGMLPSSVVKGLRGNSNSEIPLKVEEGRGNGEVEGRGVREGGTWRWRGEAAVGEGRG